MIFHPDALFARTITYLYAVYVESEASKYI